MLNVFSRFILWLKKIFLIIRPEPKYEEKTTENTRPPEEKPKLPKEKTLEISSEQEPPLNYLRRYEKKLYQ